MRKLATAVLFIVSLTVAAPVASDPLKGPPALKPAISSADFCEICKCCKTAPAFLADTLLKTKPAGGNITIISRDAVGLLEKLSRERFRHRDETMRSIVRGQNRLGLSDFCSQCGCCSETSTKILIQPPKSMPNDLSRHYMFLK